MKFLKIFSFLLSLSFAGCVGSMNPTGGNSTPNYPYFITQDVLVIKNIQVPKGTTLVYKEQFLKEGQQDQLMDEDKLTAIRLPVGQTIIWGGVPVTSVTKFFNSEMRGFSVTASFKQLSPAKQTKFSQLWQSCSDDLDITVQNIQDWSFNKSNIADVEGCSVLYQRYFKDDREQQQFLDRVYTELMKIHSK